MHSELTTSLFVDLQRNPDSQELWEQLSTTLEGGIDEELRKALYGLFASFERIRHWEGLAQALEVVSSHADAEWANDLKLRLASILKDKMLDDEAFAAVLETVSLVPDGIKEELEESLERRGSWEARREQYASEAEDASDHQYRAAMLMRAAEAELRYAGDAIQLERVVNCLIESMRLEANSIGAAEILERIYRARERWTDVCEVLSHLVDRGSVEFRGAAAFRRAQVALFFLKDEALYASSLEKATTAAPAEPLALAWLGESYRAAEDWSGLAAVYERGLSASDYSKPERLADLLTVGEIYWKKLGHLSSAEPWFDRARRVSPAERSVVDFYREYCTANGDENRLVAIFQAAQRATGDEQLRQSIGEELANLVGNQQDSQQAIEALRLIVRQDPLNASARDQLKELYRRTENYQALGDLLRQQFERTEASDVMGRAACLKEMAEAYRLGGKGDNAVVSVMAQLIALLPEDEQVLRDASEVYERLGRWRELLTCQEKLAQISTDSGERVELFRSVARRWLEQFSNVQQATSAYENLLEASPGDEEAVEKLIDLYGKRRAWPKMFEILESQVAHVSGSKKSNLLRQMAQIAAERLNDSDRAIELYQELVGLEPSDAESLSALEKLAERAKNAKILAFTLERRFELEHDDKEKLVILQKLGGLYSEQLEDPENTVRIWKLVLEVNPGNARATRTLRDIFLANRDDSALTELYGAQNDWDGLAEVFSLSADKEEDAERKIALSYRAAMVYAENLSQPERAFRSYERILATDPTDLKAARALVPLYEQDEKWARLPALYQLILNNTDDLNEQQALLAKLVQVCGRELGDREAAAKYARQAYELDAENDVALARFEQICLSTNHLDVLVDTLRQQVLPHLSVGTTAAPAEEKTDKKKKKKKEKEEPAGLSFVIRERARKLAQILWDAGDETEAAVIILQKLVESDPSDLPSVELLQILLKKINKPDLTRWFYEFMAKSSSDDFVKVSYLDQWAKIEHSEYEDLEQAIKVRERILKVEPSHEESLDVLPRLMLAVGRLDESLAMLERHRDTSDGEAKAELELQIAGLLLERLDRPADALLACQRALDILPHDARVISVLRGLSTKDETKADAAEILAAEYAASGEARFETEALRTRLDATDEPGEKKDLYLRLADVHEFKLDSFNAAFDALSEAATLFPEDDSLWERAESLASRSSRQAELAEVYRIVTRKELADDLALRLCERAATWHEDNLGDPAGATPYLNRILTIQPGDRPAFDRLKQILTAGERWGELEALYDKAAEATEIVSERCDLLAEVALVCEEILEEHERAALYYERILEADDRHSGALSSLDRIYGHLAQYEKQRNIMAQRLEIASTDELNDLRKRLATLALDKLHEPEHAIDQVEILLAERPNDQEARELAERLLNISILKVRAAACLEPVYEARDDIRSLANVLDIRAESLAADEASDPYEYKELLRRIAMLKDERLRDDQGTFAVLSKLVPLDPEDDDARERLLSAASRLNEHEQAVAVLVKAADATDLPHLKASLWMRVAETLGDILRQTDKAEVYYRRCLTLDPTDPDLVLPAAEALSELYQTADQVERLIEVLDVRLALVTSSVARIELLSRLGSLNERAERPDAAIIAWRGHVEENPGDAVSLEALDRLLTKTERWEELVEILEQRKELSHDSEIRKGLMVRIADVWGNRLNNIDEAIEIRRAITEEFGADAESLSQLEELQEKAERYFDLVDTLEKHLELSYDPKERLALMHRLGVLRVEKLNNAQGALEAFRDALSLDPTFTACRDSLRELLDTDDIILKREVAEALLPLYEAEQDNQSLVDILIVLAACQDDVLEKLEALRRAADTAEYQLQNNEKAFELRASAVRHAAGHTELAPWLDDLSRIAEVTGRRKDEIEILEGVVPEIFDGEVQLAVVLRIATVAQNQLSDQELSIRYFKMALEVRPDCLEALRALEELYRANKDDDALLEILSQRYECSIDEVERRELIIARAELLAGPLERSVEAIELYQEVLFSVLDQRAIKALEKLYPAAERYFDLMELLERQLSEHDADHASIHLKMASLAKDKLEEVHRALDEADAALSLDPQHPGTVSFLSDWCADVEASAETRTRAASILENVYMISGDWDKVLETLRIRLDVCEDSLDSRELLERIAQLLEEQKEDYAGALTQLELILALEPPTEDSLAELRRVARAGDLSSQLAEIFAKYVNAQEFMESLSAEMAGEAAEILAGDGKVNAAIELYEKALSFIPDNLHWFESLERLLQSSEQFEELIGLYRQALDSRYEPEERQRLLNAIGVLHRDKLEQSEEALLAFSEAMEVDETDEVSTNAVIALLTTLERWPELAQALERRADALYDPAESAPFRIQLAKLQLERLEDADAALVQVESILRELPDEKAALELAEQLIETPEVRQRVLELLVPTYTDLDKWQELLKLTDVRLEVAADDYEKLSILREAARTTEVRANELEAARALLKTALLIQPDDADLRADYERLAENANAWDELVDTYQSILDESPDLMGGAELLEVVARTHDSHRDSPREALASYVKLLELDASNETALSKSEMLAMMLSDWARLVTILEIKAEQVFDAEERGSILRQLGETKRDMLEDPTGARLAYQRAFDADPSSSFGLDCLIELVEKAEDKFGLDELYSQRIELSYDDADTAYEFSWKLAQLKEAEGDSFAAISSFQRALELRSSDPATLAELNRLYREGEMWSELLDNLRLEAASAKDAARRIEIRCEMGELLAEKMLSAEEALDCYRLVVEADATHSVAIAAIVEIARNNEHLRESISLEVGPLLEASGEYAAAVELLQLRCESELEPAKRAENYRSLAALAENYLKDAKLAAEAACLAVAAQPEREDLQVEAERLARANNSLAEYVETLEKSLNEIFDSGVVQSISARVGRIASEDLKDYEIAVRVLEKAIEQVGDQDELLRRLDALYQQLERHTDRVGLLDRLAMIAESPEARASIRAELGTLHIAEFQSIGEGIDQLRMALDEVPTQELALAELNKLLKDPTDEAQAFEILEQAHRMSRNTTALAALYERRVEAAGSAEERVQMRMDLARVLEDETGDSGAAQAVLQLSLAELPDHIDVNAEIERLASMNNDWGGAALALLKACDNVKEESPKKAAELCARAAEWAGDRGGDRDAAERCLVKSLEFNPDDIELLNRIDRLQTELGKDAARAVTLRRLAQLAGSSEERLDLLKAARELVRPLETEQDLLLGICTDALEVQATAWAYEDLESCFAAKGEHDKVVEALLEHAKLLEQDSAEALRAEAARLLRVELGDLAGARDLYATLWSERADSSDYRDALLALNEELEDWSALRGVIETLIEQSDGQSRIDLRLQLVELLLAKLEDGSAAEEQLQAVVAEDIDNQQATKQLSELYEEDKQFAKLSVLLGKQCERAKELGANVELSVLLAKQGEIQRTHLKDLGAAVLSFRALTELQPSDLSAWSALQEIFAEAGEGKAEAEVLQRLIELSEGTEKEERLEQLATLYEKDADLENRSVVLSQLLELRPADSTLRDRVRKAHREAKAWQALATVLVGDAEAQSGETKARTLQEAAKLYSEKLGDGSTAAELLSEAAKLVPDDRDLLLDLCDAYSAGGRASEAVQTLEQIVESFGGRRSKELAEIRRRLANAYVSLGEPAKAMAELDDAFRIEPGNIAVRRQLGILALEQGDFAKASTTFRTMLVLRFDADSPITKAEVYLYLAKAHQGLGEPDKAIQHLERAVQTDASLVEAAELLAMLKG